MKLNIAETNTKTTHEGGRAFPRLSVERQLRRSVLACLLWEDQFYEDGMAIADRIATLAHEAPAQVVADLAVEARTAFKLRHAPLLLASGLAAKGGRIAGDTIAEVVQRPDELAELVAIYWRNGKVPLSKQMKLGLARAFRKFDEYQFAKYDRSGAIKLRDVMFLVHPKPRDDEQKALYRRIADQQLATPDTWEVGLSAGGDKRETFERLLRESKLGYLALLRNLRNMTDAGVDGELIRGAILARKGAHNVLPFRYLMAARTVPKFEHVLDESMQDAISTLPELAGETILLVDTSGSMDAAVSGKSRVKRSDAAAMLGALVRGDIRCFAFATTIKEIPRRLGMAGVDAFQAADVGWGTNIGGAIRYAEARYPDAARIIVVTDEQSHDNVSDPKARRAYMINVASYQHGVGYGRWTHIDGFSEATHRYITEAEAI